MNSKRITPAGVVVASLAVAALALGGAMYSGTLPVGSTGAPGEHHCGDCHSGTPASGSLEIMGVPDIYTPGNTYTLTVQLQEPGQQRWGFQLTALETGGGGAGAGSFTITDVVNTVLIDTATSTRDYVNHTTTGTYNGTPDGPVSWAFDWTAPATDIGRVTFFASGCAADGNSHFSGDIGYDAATVAYSPQDSWVCGDPDANGMVNISDAVYLISYIFGGGPAPDPLLSGDCDCNGMVNISDAVYLISYIFGGGPEPCAQCK